MSLWRDFTGKSGAVYRFGVPVQLAALPGGGNVLYARETPEGLAVVYLGHTENLAEGAMARWSEAVERFGATHMLVRLNVSRHLRRNEHADMVDAYQPPMNGGEAAPDETP